MRQLRLLVVLLVGLLSWSTTTQAFLVPHPRRPLITPQPRQQQQQQVLRHVGGGGSRLLGGGALRTSSTKMTMMLEPASLDTGASVLLAAEAWVAPARTAIETILDFGGVAFLIRIILSWYPQVNLNKLPANLIAWPTEPFLAVTRVVVPPAFGVDISPIIWFAFLNFLREILTSDQGLLSLMLQK